jgi:hypothetical protein
VGGHNASRPAFALCRVPTPLADWRPSASRPEYLEVLASRWRGQGRVLAPGQQMKACLPLPRLAAAVASAVAARVTEHGAAGAAAIGGQPLTQGHALAPAPHGRGRRRHLSHNANNSADLQPRPILKRVCSFVCGHIRAVFITHCGTWQFSLVWRRLPPPPQALFSGISQ